MATTHQVPAHQGGAQPAHRAVVRGLGPRWLPGHRRLVQLPLTLQL